MSEFARNFYNFYLGDDVYRLGGGVIPEIADALEFDISETPNVDDLSRLVGVVGKNKVLRINEEIQGIDLDQAAYFVERSGVQLPLDRSLWIPEVGVPDDLETFVVTGAVANWQDRTARYLADRPRNAKVLLLTGNREVGKDANGKPVQTELDNPNFQRYVEAYGQAPTESQYAAEFVTPLLSGKGYEVDQTSFETGSADEIAESFIQTHSELFDTENKIAFARVANAGIQLAVQFREAAKKLGHDFDRDLGNPQVFVITDTFPIARTEDEVKDAPHFQSPFSALRQVVLTAKLLHETIRGA